MVAIKEIYLWTTKVRPAIKWTLYKETDFKNSSWGWFRVVGWNGASSASRVSFNTTNGYIYSSSTQSQANILPLVADLTTFSSAKAIKIVCDWIYRGNNTNSYNTSVWVWSVRFGKNSSEDRLWDATLLTWSKPWFSTWYTCEFIIKNWEYWILTVSNWSTYQTNYSWSDLVSTWSHWWFASSPMYGFGYINRNQGTWCQLKDIHAYIWN